MSIATDPAEAAYFERLEQLKVLNAKREAAGLPPILPGDKPESHVDRMWYAAERGLPWHVDTYSEEGDIKGTPLAQTSAAAMKLSGLDWEVGLGDVKDPRSIVIPNKYGIYRLRDFRCFGFASKRYKPIQNLQMFEFLDGLVSDGILHYEAAGSLYDSSVIWILARMEEDWNISVNGNVDRHFTYILVQSSHDGSGTMKTIPTDVRVICRNTSRLAFAQADVKISVRHSGNVKENLQHAATLLRVTTAQQQRYQEWQTQLVETPVDSTNVDAIVGSLFEPLDEKTSAQKQAAIRMFLDIYNSEVIRGGENAYALAQAVTGFSSHGLKLRPHQGEEDMRSFLSGNGAFYTKKGLTALQDTTGVYLESAAI